MIGLWNDDSKTAYFCHVCSSGPYRWPTPKCGKCSGEDRIVRKVKIERGVKRDETDNTSTSGK